MTTKSIVLIDDEMLVRVTLSRILTRAGYTVVEATNGEQGLEAVARSTPDLVICDILMPTKEGIETIRELHRTRPMLPIVAISGGGRNSATATSSATPSSSAPAPLCASPSRHRKSSTPSAGCWSLSADGLDKPASSTVGLVASHRDFDELATM